MNNFWSRFVGRFFEKMLAGGIGVLIGAVYCFVKGLTGPGVTFLIFGLVCVAGGSIYKLTNKNN